MSQATLAVAVSTDEASIKVSGRATFECTENLKAFCTKVLDRNIPTISFIMENCTGMDSTFMGMMAKISLQARQQRTVISLCNINQDNKKNLFSLGLKDMFTFTESQKSSDVEWSDVENKEISQSDQRQNIIDAHQTLMDVHEENIAEFKDIVDFLNLEKEMEEGSE